MPVRGTVRFIGLNNSPARRLMGGIGVKVPRGALLGSRQRKICSSETP
jgi:hypothetical protein